jgi:hypothetical protein
MNEMIIELYMDDMFLGWGTWVNIPKYRANGYRVVVTQLVKAN